MTRKSPLDTDDIVLIGLRQLRGFAPELFIWILDARCI